VRDWWTLVDGRTDTDLGRIAWYQTKGIPEYVGYVNTDFRFYHCSWPNPRPEVEVVSVDFVSHMTTSAPFVIALTVE
ncbi:MAG: hypothetical protein ACYC23_23200, partial [Limisphaerales bacterium]